MSATQSQRRKKGASSGGAAAASMVTKIGPFIVGKTIGIGSSRTKVKQGIHETTGERVAIKIMDKQAMDQELYKKMREREIAVTKLVEHPNIVRLLDVFETSKKLYLILELVDGETLFDYVYAKGRLEEREAMFFFYQIIDALDYCHRHLICHRDLKPENFLLTKDRTLKICDFGLASVMAKDHLHTRCGTANYASPELLKGLGYDGKLADIWSAGVNLYVMVTGSLPFDDENPRRLLIKIRAGQFCMPNFLTPEMMDLISSMMTVDPQERITIAGIKQHPCWLRYPHTPNPNYQGPEPEMPVVTDPSELDKEILTSLKLLGWTDEEALVASLCGTGPCIEKVFYFQLSRKKANPSLNSFSSTFIENSRRSVECERPSTKEGKPAEGQANTDSTPPSEDAIKQLAADVEQRGTDVAGSPPPQPAPAPAPAVIPQHVRSSDQSEALASLDRILGILTDLNSAPKGDLRIRPIAARATSAMASPTSTPSTSQTPPTRVLTQSNNTMPHPMVRKRSHSDSEERLIEMLTRAQILPKKGDLRIQPNSYTILSTSSKLRKAPSVHRVGQPFTSDIPLNPSLAFEDVQKAIHILFGPKAQLHYAKKKLSSDRQSVQLVPILDESLYKSQLAKEASFVVPLPTTQADRENLKAYLARFELDQYANLFTDHQITLSNLHTVKREDLQNWGLSSPGVIAKILRMVDGRAAERTSTASSS